MIKNIYKSPPVNSTFKDRGVNVFPLRLRRRKDIFSHHCSSVVLEAPADTIRHVKEIKGIYIIKKPVSIIQMTWWMREKILRDLPKKIPQNPSRVREFSKFAGKKVNTHQKNCIYIY